MNSFNVSHTTPSGKVFVYTLTGITRRCWTIEAAHTGETRQFRSKSALRGFCRQLADHLNAKYPAVEAGEIVTLAWAA